MPSAKASCWPKKNVLLTSSAIIIPYFVSTSYRLLLKLYAYIVLIQDIIQLMEQINETINHTLREGNYCADFLEKFDALLTSDLFRHDTPQADLDSLLQSDAGGTFYLRS